MNMGGFSGSAFRGNMGGFSGSAFRGGSYGSIGIVIPPFCVGAAASPPYVVCKASDGILS